MPILTITDLTPEELAEAVPAIKRIFFATSSRQEFSSPLERENFWNNWTSLYFQHFRQFILVARENHRTIGYLMGCPESNLHLDLLKAQNPTYSLFADLFAHFPAHLHINLSEEARGRGLGGVLIQAFLQKLCALETRGVHIVTTPQARNRMFYFKEGFTYEIERPWKEKYLLFMGKSLEHV